MLYDNDIEILKLLARYYVLTRDQIQSWLFPEHSSGRMTRKRLAKLRTEGYVIKHRIPVALPNSAGAAPVYFLAGKAGQVLADVTDDELYRLITGRTPSGHLLQHWIALNNTHRKLELACEANPDVELVRWINEWETIVDEKGEKQFTLHTKLFEQPALSCSPDAAFLLSAGGQQMVYYVEQDCGTSSPKQVARRKSKGYAELSNRNGHRKHFPDTTLDRFRILCVTTRRYRVGEIGRQLQLCPSPDLWLISDENELTPESFLTGDVHYDVQGEAGPLIKATTAPPTALTTTVSASSPDVRLPDHTAVG